MFLWVTQRKAEQELARTRLTLSPCNENWDRFAGLVMPSIVEMKKQFEERKVQRLNKWIARGPFKVQHTTTKKRRPAPVKPIPLVRR